MSNQHISATANGFWTVNDCSLSIAAKREFNLSNVRSRSTVVRLCAHNREHKASDSVHGIEPEISRLSGSFNCDSGDEHVAKVSQVQRIEGIECFEPTKRGEALIRSVQPKIGPSQNESSQVETQLSIRFAAGGPT